jgi:hypothetical protein
MFDFCFDDEVLVLYKRLCRYYVDIDPEATAVNGRDKVSQKWSFKSEPLWKGCGIHYKVTNLISLWLINPSLREEIALKKRRPFWTYCCSLEKG